MSTWLAVTTIAAICASFGDCADAAPATPTNAPAMIHVLSFFILFSCLELLLDDQRAFHSRVQRADVWKGASLLRLKAPPRVRLHVAGAKAAGTGRDVVGKRIVVHPRDGVADLYAQSIRHERRSIHR